MPNNQRETAGARDYIVLAIAGLVVNLTTGAVSCNLRIFEDGFVAFLFGQCGLLCIWAVFGTGRWFLRWPVTVIAAEGLIAAFSLPIIALESVPTTSMLVTAMIAPSFLLAAQLPLYGVKLFRGYRIVTSRAPLMDSGMRGGQFGISDMLGSTTLVAVVFALLETARTSLEKYVSHDFWLEILISCLIFTVCSTLILLPCLWAVMRSRHKGCAALIIGGVALGGPCLVATLMFPYRTVVIQGSVIIGVLTATLSSGLGLMRAAGFVMLRPGETLPVAPAENDATQTEEASRA